MDASVNATKDLTATGCLNDPVRSLAAAGRRVQYAAWRNGGVADMAVLVGGTGVQVNLEPAAGGRDAQVLALQNTAAPANYSNGNQDPAVAEAYRSALQDNEHAVLQLKQVSKVLIRGRDDTGTWKQVGFNGPAGFHFEDCSQLELRDFKIEGAAEGITQAQAEAARSWRSQHPDCQTQSGCPDEPDYFSGVGVRVEGSHHVLLEALNVHDCPGAGVYMENSGYS